MTPQTRNQPTKKHHDREDRIARNRAWDDLAAAARRGDRAALNRLLSLLQPYLFALAFRRLGNEADALDIVQDTLLKLLIHLESFDPTRGCVAAWAARICHNQIVNSLRHRRVRTTERVPLEEFPSGAGSPVGVAEEAETRAMIQAAVDELPRDERAAITLRFMEEMSYKEAAAVLGVPLGTVAGRTYRALSALWQRLRRVA
jgi:RNA polymerase sigma-70 factor (ECF subfamily)